MRFTSEVHRFPGYPVTQLPSGRETGEPGNRVTLFALLLALVLIGWSRPQPIRALTGDAMRDVTVDLETTAGTITLEFFPNTAPIHVRNFIELARSGFYDGTTFHRVIPGFMIQGGDPNTRSDDPSTWGTGGSNKTLHAEFSKLPHLRGILSMARSVDPDSASSQFFICVAPAPHLDGQYTVFGKVREGMDVVDVIANARRNPANDQPYEPVVIKRAVVRGLK